MTDQEAVAEIVGIPCGRAESHEAHDWQMSATGYCRCLGVTDQEARDELADLVESVGVYIPGSHGHDYINPNRAADAIIAAGYRKHSEPEWEYGTALRASEGTIWDFEVDTEQHALAHVAECDISDHTPGESCVVVRRAVTYGPWEPVA